MVSAGRMRGQRCDDGTPDPFSKKQIMRDYNLLERFFGGIQTSQRQIILNICRLKYRPPHTPKIQEYFICRFP